MDSWQSGSESPQWTIAKNFVPNKKNPKCHIFLWTCDTKTHTHTHTFWKIGTFNKLNAFDRFVCHIFPSRFQSEMSSVNVSWLPTHRAPNHRGGQQLPEVQCEGDPTCFGDEKRLERQWIGRGPHQLGQHNEPNLAQNLDWLNFFLPILAFLFFFKRTELCEYMKRMETKKTLPLMVGCFGFTTSFHGGLSTEVSNGSHEVAPFWAEGHGVRRKFFLMKRMFAKKVWMIPTFTFYQLYDNFHYFSWVIFDVPKLRACQEFDLHW